VRPHTYKIVFAGQADRTLRAQFDECEVSTGPDTTTLHAELPDQAALCGLVQRIVGLGLDIIHVQLVTSSLSHDDNCDMTFVPVTGTDLSLVERVGLEPTTGGL
jgi:hypothetical protein